MTKIDIIINAVKELCNNPNAYLNMSYRTNHTAVAVYYNDEITIIADYITTGNKPYITLTAYNEVTDTETVDDIVCYGIDNACLGYSDEIIETQVRRFCNLYERGLLTWDTKTVSEQIYDDETKYAYCYA